MRFSPARLLLTALPIVCARPAVAQTDAMSCANAHEQGQNLSSADQLLKAKVTFEQCADPGCPAVIRSECTVFLEKLSREMPSLIVAVRDSAGHDVTTARISIAGKVVPNASTGSSTALDPGVYDVTAESVEGVTQTIKVVLHRGEQDRVINITLAAQPTPAARAAPKVRRASPTPSLVIAGVGVVAVGSFGYFALSGHSQENSLEGCRPTCGEAAYEVMRDRYLIADVSLGVGLVSLGVAGVLWATRSTATDTKSVAVDARPIRRGGILSTTYAF